MKPELCSTLSFGSGIIDNRIIIYDYAKGASYNLSDRGQYDYTLNMQNGKLMVEKRRYNQDELLGSGELVYQDNTYQVMWDHESETVEAQIANPWLSFDNLISAEKYAGFELGIPETISDTYKVVSYSVLDGEKPLLHTTEPFIRSRMETDESAVC